MSQKFCIECGTPLNGSKFCTSCGAKAPEEPVQQTMPVQQAVPVQQTTPVQQMAPIPQAVPVQPVMTAQPVENGEPEVKGTKYEPITTGGFIGITLLMLLPCINIILILIWSFGGCKKIQKTYWARASLIFMAIGLVLSLVVGLGAKALVKNFIPVSLMGGTEKYENLIEAVENEDREALLDMGYSEEDIDEVLGE